ncbi:MAG TPA: hypothetical protein VK692_07765, partial [Chthoniobacterales bacterium]|nr:hypothetical protein [Chthoniobacterales bacterium]
LKARIGASLEKKRFRQTERDLEKARQLLETSRQAGMAEVATNILHNVGNVLNSVNVSGRLILDKVERSKVTGITKAVSLLEAHKSDLPGFFEDQFTGKRLLNYLSKLDAYLTQEQAEIEKEVHTLLSNILHIKKIVAMQQSYARVSETLETLNIEDLVEDALQLNCGALEPIGSKWSGTFREIYLLRWISTGSCKSWSISFATPCRPLMMQPE